MMPTEKSAVDAYWAIMRTLAPAEIRSTVAVSIQEQFIETALVNPGRAGVILNEALLDVEWDWPSWRAYAEGEDFDSVACIVDECPAGSKDRKRRLSACRRQMAVSIASRVSSASYWSERYGQLLDPDLLLLRPCWKFSVVEGVEAPPACAAFDGKVLPAREALRVFPRLPCEHIGCRCSVSAVKSE